MTQPTNLNLSRVVIVFLLTENHSFRILPEAKKNLANEKRVSHCIVSVPESKGSAVFIEQYYVLIE